MYFTVHTCSGVSSFSPTMLLASPRPDMMKLISEEPSVCVCKMGKLHVCCVVHLYVSQQQEIITSCRRCSINSCEAFSSTALNWTLNLHKHTLDQLLLNSNMTHQSIFSVTMETLDVFSYCGNIRCYYISAVGCPLMVNLIVCLLWEKGSGYSSKSHVFLWLISLAFYIQTTADISCVISKTQDTKLFENYALTDRQYLHCSHAYVIHYLIHHENIPCLTKVFNNALVRQQTVDWDQEIRLAYITDHIVSLVSLKGCNQISCTNNTNIPTIWDVHHSSSCILDNCLLLLMYAFIPSFNKSVKKLTQWKCYS